MMGRLVIALLFFLTFVNGNPIGSDYSPTTDISIMSRESGLTAVTVLNGVSFKFEGAEQSHPFALAVKKESFDLSFKTDGAEHVSERFLILTVTKPNTDDFIIAKIQFNVDKNGMGHAALIRSTDVEYLGGINKHGIVLTAHSNGTFGAADLPLYNYCVDYDSTHRMVLVTIASENLAPGTVITFSNDVKYLAQKRRSSTTIKTSTALTTTPLTSSTQPDSIENAPESEGDIETTEAVAKASSTMWIVIPVVVVICFIIVVAVGVGIGIYCCRKKQNSAKNTSGVSGASMDQQKNKSAILGPGGDEQKSVKQLS